MFETVPRNPGFVMPDPRAGAGLSIDDIAAMCDELIAAHGGWLPKYH